MTESIEDRLRYYASRFSVVDAAETTHVIMNNCYANYGTTNALEIASMIREAYGKAGPRLAE